MVFCRGRRFLAASFGQPTVEQRMEEILDFEGFGVPTRKVEGGTQVEIGPDMLGILGLGFTRLSRAKRLLQVRILPCCQYSLPNLGKIRFQSLQDPRVPHSSCQDIPKPSPAWALEPESLSGGLSRWSLWEAKIELRSTQHKFLFSWFQQLPVEPSLFVESS